VRKRSDMNSLIGFYLIEVYSEEEGICISSIRCEYAANTSIFSGSCCYFRLQTQTSSQETNGFVVTAEPKPSSTLDILSGTGLHRMRNVVDR